MTMTHAVVTILIAAGLTASPAFAQQAKQHPHGTATAQVGKSGMMHDSEAMKAHREKMQEMRALMEKANATSDPAMRQRLMAEHREKMQAQMASMMQGDNAAMMQACQERMAMMHDMMGQMAAAHKMAPGK